MRFQKVASREDRTASLLAFQRRKCGVLVWRVWSARLAQTSWSMKAVGPSAEWYKSYDRQPSSFRVGPTRARSSASSSISWPSRGRSWTTSVTASFGGLGAPLRRAFRVLSLLRRRDLVRRPLELLPLRFAIVRGILLQEGRIPNAHPGAGVEGAQNSGPSPDKDKEAGTHRVSVRLTSRCFLTPSS